MKRKIVDDTRRSGTCRMTVHPSALVDVDRNKPVYAIWEYSHSTQRVRYKLSNDSVPVPTPNSTTLVRKMTISGKTLIVTIPNPMSFVLGISPAQEVDIEKDEDGWYTVTVAKL